MVITDFTLRFGNDILVQFLHMIDIRIQYTGGEHLHNSASLTFTRTVHVHGESVDDIGNYDVSTGLIHAPKDLNTATAQRLFATDTLSP